jgi:succinate-semialdehyde dehydrogenase/glutarate-semialdehyde dehydrogenase
MAIESINPATGELIETFAAHTPSQVEGILDRAHLAFLRWRTASFSERSALLRRVAAYLREQKSQLAKVATLEMGKAIIESEAEVEKCAWNCEYYAEEAERFLQDEVVATNAAASYVAFRPLGVILAVMPWNFPYWQVFRFAAPALMAGNTAVLKHASNVSRVALEIERIFAECGADPGLFSTILVPGSEVSSVIASRHITAVTLTGSEQAGVAIATASSTLLKKTVLELGGSDAFIVLEDADLEAAAEMAARSRFQNCGQSCIAAKRFIVVERVADLFTEKFVSCTERLRVGDPLDHQTQIGPMARLDLRHELDRQVRESRRMGADALLGGAPADGSGAFYAPTILTQVTIDMPVFCEETFGPVAPVIRARDAEHAVELANASQFGLGGNLWTRDLEKAREMAALIESGNVFINGMTASDPRLPFGGVKHSGYGRELSQFGIREFVNVQTVWIGPAAPGAAAGGLAHASPATE